MGAFPELSYWRREDLSMSLAGRSSSARLSFPSLQQRKNRRFILLSLKACPVRAEVGGSFVPVQRSRTVPLAFGLQRGHRGQCDDLPNGAGDSGRQGKKSVLASCRGPTALPRREKQKGRQTTQGISHHFWASTKGAWLHRQGFPGTWLARPVWGSEAR